MPKFNWLRFALSLIVFAVFVGLGYFLINKQKYQYHFMSFKLEDATQSIYVPDVDRLTQKIRSGIQVEENLPESLNKGLQKLVEKEDFSFNDFAGNGCFLSYSGSNFVFVIWNNGLTFEEIPGLIEDHFGLASSYSNELLIIEDLTLKTGVFAEYLAFSPEEIQVNRKADHLSFGNADYFLFKDTLQNPVQHVLSDGLHFTIERNHNDGLKGRPVEHFGVFSQAPMQFDRITFYGSTRFEEDQSIWFENPAEDAFAWTDNGFLIVANDSFQIVIANQNANRDLKLMLEEQTLKSKGDTVQINYFSIGNYNVMPFDAPYQWNKFVPELNRQVNYFTENDQYVVMANSIPAMRWYLSVFQLGELMLNDPDKLDIYQKILPKKIHYADIQNQDNGSSKALCKVWSQTDCLEMSTSFNLAGNNSVGVNIAFEFPINLVPKYLSLVPTKDSTILVASSERQMMAYFMDGTKAWQLNLSSALVQQPSVQDLDNDGNFEIVLFQSDQIDVVDSKGKSVGAFPARINGISNGGIAVNYDNLYDYRFFVSNGTQIQLYNEAGKIVDGWTFAGMDAPLSGDIHHFLVNGKDIISFHDQTGKQYAVNRRGESRLGEEMQFKLPNETDFVTGSLESSLRKMGYKNQYILNYYLTDGQRDSLKVDQEINPVEVRWLFNKNRPLMLADEVTRFLVLDEFGYVKGEVLKPGKNAKLIEVQADNDFKFLFVDNSQNKLYLLNNFGQMIIPKAVPGSEVCYLDGNLLYTFVGTKVVAYKF